MLIAQMNVAHALYDLQDPAMADFMGSLDRINALAEATPGFVWRLKSDSGNATEIRVSDDPRLIVNLTVWESVEALFGYVYLSDHRGVMVRRRQWFRKPEGPYQVLWWTEGVPMPDAAEGLARLAHLAEHGPTPHAFTFKTVFPQNAAGPVDWRPEPHCVGWS